jgi:hypothetical protein
LYTVVGIGTVLFFRIPWYVKNSRFMERRRDKLRMYKTLRG